MNFSVEMSDYERSERMLEWLVHNDVDEIAKTNNKTDVKSAS